ncbi:MFS transporter [Cellulomonas fimi]|uniref:Major facilitator superfamily MFS_1 n=1 Tax=Cellulomonas fimi (strain ATCC 484 / DSM 20113 / JCM 1341 / CCUG 24087 / LMG 16345 / NBRC 15513 / NCIMB 8980 / NCTC 7547 / NRS-133) TaxID=590998 RepID=F4H8H8_CELFA|nr:MFS transporter [Cellulomonas fimi]AEE45859.1 major facilitator superfamily MFS_1 [Cellulomonas fimi ATCC 484]NNH07843.1 MFS transporter [Cellulomonas fimi]VEH30810.1 Major Facilitator Superfamily [Cellulomonas fimi]
MAPSHPRLQRDRFTVALYGCFVVWGWLLYSFNPSVPLLADDLGITGAQAGLHGTAMAAGAILTAFLTPRSVRARGRRWSLLAACAVVVAGTVLLLTASVLAVSLVGMFVLAIGGNLAISSAQPGLAQHHGPAASAAVTEANGVGSGVGLLGPLAVGACVAAGFGWRPAVAVTALLAVATAVLVARQPVGGAMTPAEPAADATPADPQRADLAEVPRRAGAPTWWFLAAIVAALAIENATTYWATDLVREQTGAGAGIAAATTAGLVAGMTAIRFVVAPLSLRVRPAHLLAVAFLVAIVGWAILWTATVPGVALTGLVVAGFGYGAQYPLSIALLLAAAPGQGDRAQARATLAGGIAIGVAPFALGALADVTGAHTAFLVVPVIALVGAVASWCGGRSLQRVAGAHSGEPVGSRTGGSSAD